MKIRNLVDMGSVFKGLLWKTCAVASLLACSATVFAEVRHGQYYLMKSGVGNFYMSGQDGNAEQQKRVTISNAAGKYRPSAIWKAMRNSDGTFSFVNYKSDLALDVQWGNANAGATMHFWPFNRGSAQRYQLHKVDGNYYTLAPALNPSLRLDVHNGLQRINTPVKTWHANGNPAQKWKFEPLDPRSMGLAKISKQELTIAANAMVRNMRVKLDNFTPRRFFDKNNDVSWYAPGGSSLSFLGQIYPITIPEITRGVRDKRYYVEDINLRAANARFSGSDVIIGLVFEHNNQPDIKGMCSDCIKAREDSGAPDFRFDNNRWEIRLGLIPWRGSVAFEFKSARFLGDIAGGGLGVRAEIAERHIVPAMSASIRTALAGSRDSVARQFAQSAKSLNIAVSNVRHVVVDGNHVFLINS